MAWSESKFNKITASIYLLAYSVGLLLHIFLPEMASLTTPYFLFFLPLPFLFYELKQKDYKLIVFYFGYALFTFIIEVIGVKTGLIFGEYRYYDVLGVSVWGVPIVIGLLWSTLLISSFAIVQGFTKVRFINVLISAFLMLMIDLILEQFAISQGYWDWEKGVIPIQNYASWFILALIGGVIWYLINPSLNGTRVLNSWRLVIYFLIPFFLILLIIN